MNNSSIEILTPESVRSLRGRTPDGLMAETYACDISWEDGTPGRGFLKCFPASRSLGVVNELTGYLIAKACGLPVPQRAAVVQLNQVLVDSMEIKNCPEGVYRYAFAVSESPGRSPNSIYAGLPEALAATATREILKGWRGLSPLMAFDDWAANQDRNLGNFLIDEKGEIYVIDHSNMPVDICWTADALVPEGRFRNILIEIMTLGGSVPIEEGFVVRAAERHSDVYNSIKDELKAWWQAFLGNDPSRRAAIESFFHSRAENGSDRLSQKLSTMPV